jgi:hypothetical protein
MSKAAPQHEVNSTHDKEAEDTGRPEVFVGYPKRGFVPSDYSCEPLELLDLFQTQG